MHLDLDLLRLSLFPARGLGKVRVERRFSGELDPAWRSPTIAGFALRTQPVRLAAYLAILVVRFAVSIALTLALGQLTTAMAIFPAGPLPWILAGLVALRFLAGQAELYVFPAVLRHNYAAIMRAFEVVSWPRDQDGSFARRIGRDVDLVVGAAAEVPRFPFTAIAFGLALVAVHQLSGAAGMIGLLLVPLFVPVIALVGHRRGRLIDRILQLSRTRLDRTAAWLDARPYLLQWRDADRHTGAIAAALHDEVAQRNRDTWWRAVVIYLAAFGKSVPTAVALVLAAAIAASGAAFTATLWLAWPVVILILSITDFYVLYRGGARAYGDLRSELLRLSSAAPASASASARELQLDGTWEIWDGTLADNTFAPPAEVDPLAELGLVAELLPAGQPATGFTLARGGANVSAGQRARILLARALNLAASERRPLRIALPLSSLDPAACARVEALLERMRPLATIELAPQVAELLAAQRARTTAPAAPVAEPESPRSSSRSPSDSPTRSPAGSPERVTDTPRTLWQDLRQFARPSFLLFLIPAACVPLLGALTAAGLGPLATAGLLVAVTAVAIGLALRMAQLVEGSVRTWAAARGGELLHAPLDHPIADLFQRLSRDITTTCDRNALYIHDGAWITGVFLVASFGAIAAFGVAAALALAAFIATAVVVWRNLVPTVVATRKASAQGHNRYLELYFNLPATAEPAVPAVRAVRRDLAHRGMTALCRSTIEMYIAKTHFGNVLSACSGLLIVALIAVSRSAAIAESTLVFLVTATLAVDFNVLTFFGALSGFESQRLSLARLTLGAAAPLASAAVRDAGRFALLAAHNPVLDIAYRPLALERGAYSLLGASGTGKTQYLRSITGLLHGEVPAGAATSRCWCVYIDRKAMSLLGGTAPAGPAAPGAAPGALETLVTDKLAAGAGGIALDEALAASGALETLVTDKLAAGAEVIALDEALAAFELREARALAERLSTAAERAGALLLLVDHRFSLPRTLDVGTLLTGDPPVGATPLPEAASEHAGGRPEGVPEGL